MMLYSRLDSKYDVKLSLNDLFDIPTIRELSQVIQERQFENTNNKTENLVLIKKFSEEAESILFLHDGFGEVDVYRQLSNKINTGFNCYGVKFDNTHYPQENSIVDIASKYKQLIVNSSIKEFSYIVGWSLGGTIAFELVRQLELENFKIGKLVIIDSPSPNKCYDPHFMPVTIESEIEFISKYLPKSDIKDYINNPQTVRNLWDNLISFFEQTNNGEILNQVISDDLKSTIPNYLHLGSREIIKYLNTLRSMQNARKTYNPKTKVRTNVDYFKSSSTNIEDVESWGSFVESNFKMQHCNENHFTILNSSEVINMFGFDQLPSLSPSINLSN